MLGSLFKQKSHYVFDYKPRYYDARKERIAQLEQKYANEAATDQDIDIVFTKNNLKSQWTRKKQNSTDKNITIRLAIIIAILVGIAAYVFQLHTLF
ncbi:hypothetical protein MWU59_06195 [Flavobacteriaceae bacterium F08102]|nr:hypothetical protein [Flavobacteriaceae bacterium F08102]